MAATAYQKLVKAKGNFCKGKTTKSRVRKAATVYVKNAVRKAGINGGDTKVKARARKEATTKANKILNGGCKMTSRVGAKKKGLQVYHVIAKKRKGHKRRRAKRSHH